MRPESTPRVFWIHLTPNSLATELKIRSMIDSPPKVVPEICTLIARSRTSKSFPSPNTGHVCCFVRGWKSITVFRGKSEISKSWGTILQFVPDLRVQIETNHLGNRKPGDLWPWMCTDLMNGYDRFCGSGRCGWWLHVRERKPIFFYVFPPFFWWDGVTSLANHINGRINEFNQWKIKFESPNFILNIILLYKKIFSDTNR